jgi:hypothetical protein
MNNSIGIEKFLQWLRFRKIRDYVFGRILDFGGNRGELGVNLKNCTCVSSYCCVNDSNDIAGIYDTIVCLAVIEHIDVREVFRIFKTLALRLERRGKIIVTTPSRMSKALLEFLAFIGLLDRKNLAEHKHYWNKNDIRDLALSSGLRFEYERFCFGFNQLAIFRVKEQ